MMNRNLIVNFHDIKDKQWFEEVILMLKSKFKLVELCFFEKTDNYKKGYGFCHITFDDGDKTFYTVAYPILLKHNVPATIFVSPKSAIENENFWFQEIQDYDNKVMMNIISRELSVPLTKIKELHFLYFLKCLPINKIHELVSLYQKETNTIPLPFQNMNVCEILEVEKSGLICIGAHTLNHPILKNETDKNCEIEISGSILELQKILGHTVRYFAYPNGTPDIDFGEREISYLRNNQISIAVSSRLKHISIHDDQFALPRIGFSHGNMFFLQIKMFMGANWERIKSLKGNSELKGRKKVIKILVG